jgi:hypothetical protein
VGKKGLSTNATVDATISERVPSGTVKNHSRQSIVRETPPPPSQATADAEMR